MVFCNDTLGDNKELLIKRHNPYFNRWFSAIKHMEYLKDNPYKSHNPYFNRWFSAMQILLF